MSDLRLSDEDKADLIGRVTILCEQGVLNQVDYVEILRVCKEACERRMEEIDRLIGKPVDIVQ